MRVARLIGLWPGSDRGPKADQASGLDPREAREKTRVAAGGNDG